MQSGLQQDVELAFVSFDVEVDRPERRGLADLAAGLVQAVVSLLLLDLGSDPFLGVAVTQCGR